MAVTIPEYITVHLGEPDDSGAPNVRVPFIDYIKNVASSEIYPTWPETALRANIYAQVTYALNRVYTEWYRSRGYDFDITSSTRYDQKYIRDREIFEPVSRIVDDLFNKVKVDIINGLKKESGKEDEYIDMLMLAKYLEKIGDHGVNIAKWQLFRANGEMM